MWVHRELNLVLCDNLKEVGFVFCKIRGLTFTYLVKLFGELNEIVTNKRVKVFFS